MRKLSKERRYYCRLEIFSAGKVCGAMSSAIRVFCSLAVSLSLISPAFAQVQSSPSAVKISPTSTEAAESAARAVVEKYFALYAAKDVDGLMSLWSEKSPDYASLKKDLQRQFTNEDYRLNQPTLSRVVAEGEKTSLRATVKLTATDPKSKQTREQQVERNFALVKEDGTWKVWRAAPAEADLAEALVKAKTIEERAALLAAEKELVTAELARELETIGSRFHDKGDYAQALPVFRLELSVAEQIGAQREIARAANFIGLVHMWQGDYAPALERFQQSFALNEALGNLSGVAATLGNIGNVHYQRGNLAQALEYYKKGLAAGELKGDKARIASALSNLGLVYHSLGSYAQALDYYQRAMALDEAAGSKQDIAIVLNNIARVYRVQGNYARALEYYQKSLALNETVGNKYGTGLVLNNIGNVYRFQGNYAQALECYQKSLATREAIGDKNGIAGSLNNLGLLYRLQGNYAKALEHLEKSLALSESLKNRDGVAVALNGIGRVHHSQGNLKQAMADHRKSLELREAMGNKSGIADTLNNIAEVYEAQGDYAQELDTATRATTLAGQIGHVEALWKGRLAAGNAHRALNNPTQARPAFEEAVNIIETLRANVAGGGEEQQRFFESKVAPYHALVGLLAREGRPAEALTFAERAKARMLLDVLQTGRVNVTKAMTGEEKEQERQLNSRLVSLNLQISRESVRSQVDQASLTELKSQLQKARLDYEAFQTSLYTAHPELRAQRGEAPVIKADELTALLPAGGALLEYVVTDDVTYLFVVTGTIGKPKADVRVFTLPVKRAALAQQIENFRQQLAQRDLGFRTSARQLYQLLLEPAQTLLRGRTNLVIVPDDKLWELPLQALLNESDRYVIETSAVSYAPSLTVLREMKTRRDRHKAAPAALLALGNPAIRRETFERAKLPLRDGKLDLLPAAEQEVKALGQLYGAARSKVYVGAEAREDRVKSEAAHVSVLHFATHGTLNDGAPMYSHLMLAPGDTKEDGLLEAWEVLQMDLQAELAVLSACETARGRVGAGEGMIGLTWALFVAGVPTSVVSQWQVESASTRDLMVSFHRGLSSPLRARHAKATKAEALRQAALKLLRQPETSHPFYWAAFVLVGDER
jgi:CHAT domain-containing protein/tetratricopeptide (TPR) repeat protein